MYGALRIFWFLFTINPGCWHIQVIMHLLHWAFFVTYSLLILENLLTKFSKGIKGNKAWALPMESQITGLQAFCMPSVSISQKDRHSTVTVTFLTQGVVPLLTYNNVLTPCPVWSLLDQVLVNKDSLSLNLCEGFCHEQHWTGQRAKTQNVPPQGIQVRLEIRSSDQIIATWLCHLVSLFLLFSFPFSSTLFFFPPKHQMVYSRIYLKILFSVDTSSVPATKHWANHCSLI